MIIDALILGVPAGVVQAVVLASLPTELVSCRNGTAICEQPTGAGFGIVALLGLVVFAINVWYYAYFEGVKGQTIGKQALSIRVVDADNNQLIGAGRGVGRYFARILSAIPCFLGYFWMIWDPQKQTWHDKIVRSSVVRA